MMSAPTPSNECGDTCCDEEPLTLHVTSKEKIEVMLQRRHHEDQNSVVIEMDDSASVDSSVDGGIRSAFSNFLFFFGSVLYVLIAVWDIKSDEGDEDDYYDDGYAWNGSYVHYFRTWTSYEYTSFVAAATYVLNAVVDYRMAQTELTNADTSRREKCWRHPLWNIAATVAFGVAAFIELFSVFVFHSTRRTHVCLVASAHAYLLSACLTMVTIGTPTKNYSTGDYLELAGDVLFMLGSVIDTVLSYYYDVPLSAHHLRIVDYFSLTSASLWLMDSVLYILADHCTWEKISAEYTLALEETEENV